MSMRYQYARNLAIISIGLVISITSGINAALYYFRAHPFDAMPTYFSSDPFIVLARSERALYSPQANRLNLDEVASAARSVLNDEPLNPMALHVLGAVKALQSKGSGVTEFLLAEQTSRRNTHNELALASSFAQDGDLVGLLRRLDRVFAVRPDLVQAYAQGFTESLNDPGMVQALLPYAHRPWFLEIIRIGLDTQQSATSISTMIDAAQKRQADDKYLPQRLIDFRGRLLHNIMEAGNFAEAQDQLLRLPPDLRQALTRMEFLKANTDATFAPLSWLLADDADKSAVLASDGGLAVEVGAEKAGVVADRMSLLKEGTYQVTQIVSYPEEDARAGLVWYASCTGDNQTLLWHQPLALGKGRIRYQGNIRIPRNCEVQHWWLKATGELGLSASSARIEQFHVIRQ